MNKTVKRLISGAIAISALSVFEPAKYIGMNVDAYADSEYGIKNLEVNSGTSSDKLQLYSDSHFKNKTEFDKDTKTYYTETSSNFINLNFEAEKGYIINAFKKSRDTAAAYKSGEKIFIGSGTTVIYVRTYEKGNFDPDDVRYDVEKEYQIYVTRKDSQKEDDDQDSIYLKNITLDAGTVDFDEKITSYDVAVEVADSTISVEAKPENEGDSVSVNGYKLDPDDKEKREKEVRLKLGSNIVKIEVRNEKDKKRVYTLNVVRGDDNVDVLNGGSSESVSNDKNENNGNSAGHNYNTQNTNTTDNNQQSSNTTIYKNQWATENGIWKYYDATGQCIKNMWFNDRNTGKEYYFYPDGTMATGWIAYNGQWYYLGQDGAKQTGWKEIGGNWYYLNASGIMQTGWFKNYNGKWYYFYNTGIMAQNTVIDGYTIGSDGAVY